MAYHGDFKKNDKVHIYWMTTTKEGGRADLATNGSIRVYPNDSLTEITAGITYAEAHDGLTGVHRVTIDTANAAYTAGNDYAVVLTGAVVDGENVQAVLGAFSLENRSVDVARWQGTAPNALVSGRVDASAGAMAANVLTAAAIATDAITAAKIASGALSLAKFAADALEGIADNVLKRPIANVEPGAAWRTLYGAVASLVNRVRISGGNLEVFKTDDATVLKALVASADAAQDPITELDPP